MHYPYQDPPPPRKRKHLSRSMPNSPVKEHTYHYSSKGCLISSPESSTCSNTDWIANENIYQSRIYRECEEPMKSKPGCGMRNAEVQVTATEITCPECTQTGPSLAQQRPDLPRRSFDRVNCKSPRARWNGYMSCDSPKERSLAGHKDPVCAAVQVDQRDICSSESIQTGPSLCATGPFCRFDYKLKKVRVFKDEGYADCICPVPIPSSVPCNINRDGCSTRHQQVCANDIMVGEHAQTGDMQRCNPEVVMQSTGTQWSHRKVCKNDALLDCERPDPPSSHGQKCTRNFMMQVQSTNICPSKQCQTETCLTGHAYPYSGWEDCEQQCGGKTKSQPAKQFSCKHFSVQVNSMDICDCQESQTGSSRSLCKPARGEACRNAKSLKKQARYPIVIGKGRNFKFDDCACPRAYGSPGCPSDACTQVRADDITTSSYAQMDCSPPYKVKRYFVRGGAWASC